jgi:endonuclease/exonuclease/phosphatase family metal-dependent hydrolase
MLLTSLRIAPLIRPNLQIAVAERVPGLIKCGRFPVKLLQFIFSVFLMVGVANGAMSGGGDPLRVMSFNVRYGTASDGENAWDKRRELFFETIERFQPDLIGFQEVVVMQYDAIKERMKGHAFSGVGRGDGRREGEFSLVGYRKDRFTLVAEGTFWLSETPTAPGSIGWDAALPRICSWVRLRETATGREVVYANTHFDHRGRVARHEAARVLSEQLRSIAKGVPAILTGDFNLNERHPAYKTLVNPSRWSGWIRWIDSYRTVYPVGIQSESSTNGFTGKVEGLRIDFIFHTAHFKATAAAIDRSSRDGRYPSDHYPVTAVLGLGN